MAKERDLTFDALKIFAIFLVLWGHCILHLTSREAADDALFRVIYSFHMPLFMTMAGYFSASALGMTFRDLLAAKGRQLILPSVVVGSVYILDGLAFGELSDGVRSFIGMPWFLKCTFLCFVLYYLCGRVFRSPVVAALAGVAVSLAIGRFNFMWMYPCFLFGVLVRNNIRWIKENAGMLALLSGLLFGAMLLYWDAGFWITRDKAAAIRSLPDTTLLRGWLYWFSYKITIGFAGTVFFISLFEYLSERLSPTPLGRRVCGWGRQTLGIYLDQTVIIEIVMSRWVKIDSASPAIFDFIIAPAVSLGVLLLCLWLINLTRRSRVASTLLLGLPWKRAGK